MCICVQSILIIHRVLVCKFIDSLKFICNPAIDTCGNFMVIHEHAGWKKKLSQQHIHSQIKLNEMILFLLVSPLIQ